MNGAAPPRTLVFTRGAKLWGVDARVVASVAVAPPVTRVPAAVLPVLGLVGWNGAALPLLEPGRAVEAAPRAMLVVHCDAGPVALAADDVPGFDDYAGTLSLLDPGRLYAAATDAIRRAQRVG